MEHNAERRPTTERHSLFWTIEIRFSVLEPSGRHATNWIAFINHLHTTDSRGRDYSTFLVKKKSLYIFHLNTFREGGNGFRMCNVFRWGLELEWSLLCDSVTLGDIRRAHSPLAISLPCWPPAESEPSSASHCRWHLPQLPPPSPAPSSERREGEFLESYRGREKSCIWD